MGYKVIDGGLELIKGSWWRLDCEETGYEELIYGSGTLWVSSADDSALIDYDNDNNCPSFPNGFRVDGLMYDENGNSAKLGDLINKMPVYNGNIFTQSAVPNEVYNAIVNNTGIKITGNIVTPTGTGVSAPIILSSRLVAGNYKGLMQCSAYSGYTNDAMFVTFTMNATTKILSLGGRTISIDTNGKVSVYDKAFPAYPTNPTTTKVQVYDTDNTLKYVNLPEGFNIINASDISGSTFTDSQFELIKNGKPTLIIGTIGGAKNFFLSPASPWGDIAYRGTAQYYEGTTPVVSDYQINSTTKVFAVAAGVLSLKKVYKFNDKNVPAYSKGFYYYDGTNLSWKDVAQHIININATANGNTYKCQFQFEAPSATTFATTGEIASYLYDKNTSLRLPASGTFTEGGVKWCITGVSTVLEGEQKKLVFEMNKFGDGSERETPMTSFGLEVVDIVM